MTQSILVIDDSPEIHALLDARLKSEGWQLLHAESASAGLALAKAHLPDLLLLDLDMPEMSGFELCKALKDDATTASLPVIFLTGSAATFIKVQGFDLGAVDFITKPFDPAELRARVRAALRTKRYQDMLSARARIDALTGVWNRSYYEQRIGEEVAAAKRYGRQVSLVMVDVDHFKKLNDTGGHPFGDRVLQALGDILISTLRATDAACRFGGEEFALILSETGLADAVTAAERVRAKLGQLRLVHQGQVVPVRASFGVASAAQWDANALTPSVLLQAADDALYLAKREGRDCVRAARPIDAPDGLAVTVQ